MAVHDAVRPFIDSELVEKVIAEAAKTGAAIVGIVPVDTVKRVHKNKIRATLPREHLVLAQTPQVFRFDLLKRAFEKARKDGFTGTDESSLVERLEEVEVSVVQGSDRNIKITKPTDMELARLFLSEELAGITARRTTGAIFSRPASGWLKATTTSKIAKTASTRTISGMAPWSVGRPVARERSNYPRIVQLKYQDPPNNNPTTVELVDVDGLWQARHFRSLADAGPVMRTPDLPHRAGSHAASRGNWVWAIRL